MQIPNYMQKLKTHKNDMNPGADFGRLPLTLTGLTHLRLLVEWRVRSNHLLSFLHFSHCVLLGYVNIRIVE